VLFDGVCNLCNGWVRFVAARDPRGRFAFASLQSDVGRRLLLEAGSDPTGLFSIVLLEGGRVFERSTAVLHIARHLSSAWPAIAIFLAVPRPIRDRVYDWIAANRYRWFGERDACMLPTPELRPRFLDQ
jgi:predicted DCC family thiol-disulfide oxidoreductase YuxK